MRRPSIWSSTVLAVLLLAPGLIPPRPAAADEVILVPPPFVRKFPVFQYCPLPIDLAFTANAATATIHWVANIYGPIPDPPFLVFAHQSIDNVTVVPTAVHAANQTPNDQNSNSDYFVCYSQANVPFFFAFDHVAPGSVPLYELFDSPPSGWDLSQGAYYDPTRSADIDPSNTGGGHTAGVGCLGLGQVQPTPSLSDSARTSVTVTGLTAGQSYVLSAWWRVDDGVANPGASLRIFIIGPDTTPLAERSWGWIKQRYR
jgi:hypothetical protein